MEIDEYFPMEKPRKYQLEVLRKVDELLESGYKLILLDAPVGFGKSAVNTALCRKYTPSIYTTPQLSLIDQIKNDPKLGEFYVEIKGRDNYRCIKDPFMPPIRYGMCKRVKDFPCKRFVECPYYSQKLKAIRSDMVLMSLAYFIVDAYMEPPNFDNRSLVVIDEGHFLAEDVVDHVGLEISSRTLPKDIWKAVKDKFKSQPTEVDVELLMDACKGFLDTVQISLDGGEVLSEEEVVDKDKAEEFISRADRFIRTFMVTDWIWRKINGGWKAEPVYGRLFVPDMVWSRAERFIVSSATILNPELFVKETGADLVWEKDEIAYVKVPSIFPPENRPVIDYSVGRLSYDKQEENLKPAIRALENIIRNHPNDNIAVHFPSYELARKVYDQIDEEIKKKIILSEPLVRDERLRQWLDEGGVFFAVAYHEGQDWKYDRCRVQVLFKTLYPDTRDPKVAWRLEKKDFQWLMHTALVKCLQAYGRAIRAEDDYMAFYVLDSAFWELLRRNWVRLPDWFKEVVPYHRLPEYVKKQRAKSKSK